MCVCVHPETGTFRNKPQNTLQCLNTLQCVYGHLVLLLSLRCRVSLFTVCLIQDLEFLKSSKTLSCDWRLISRKSGRGSRKGQFSLAPIRNTEWKRWSQCEAPDHLSLLCLGWDLKENLMLDAGFLMFDSLFSGLLTCNISHSSRIPATWYVSLVRCCGHGSWHSQGIPGPRWEGVWRMSKTETCCWHALFSNRWKMMGVMEWSARKCDGNP